MSAQFPVIEPYESGLFDVGDGHEIYWESCGNPAGTAALFLHGGPGSGCSAGQRRFFDPSLYRAVLFDQTVLSVVVVAVSSCGSSRNSLTSACSVPWLPLSAKA